MTLSFHEVQRFRHPVLLVVIGLAAAVQWGLVLFYLVFGGTVGGDRPALPAILLPWLLLGVALPLVLWRVALVTEVTEGAVVVGFAPFERRTVDAATVVGCRVLSYRPIRDFGGWGVRWSSGDRRAYTTGGREGVELTLDGGQRIVIGSRRPQELDAAVSAMLAR